MGTRIAVLTLLAVALLGQTPADDSDVPEFPNVLLVTVDTLRADRLSGYGYSRNTSPHFDAMMDEGTRFTQARTVEPLTGPALCSLLTSRYPHEHGASRNGLRLRAGLPSLPKTLQAHGYRTSAFVGNWTLRDKLSGLAEHFEFYDEIVSRRRWFGLVKGEATAKDLNDAFADWIADHETRHSERPFFAWLHYVESAAVLCRWNTPFCGTTCFTTCMCCRTMGWRDMMPVLARPLTCWHPSWIQRAGW